MATAPRDPNEGKGFAGPRRAPPPAAAAPQTGEAPPPARMTMANVKPPEGDSPYRLLLLGTEGIGKSTFAAQAPRPVFLCAERGIEHLRPRPAAFPAPRHWTDVLDAVKSLILERHEFETLVVDTLDWLEHYVYDLVKAREKLDAKEMEAYGRWAKIAMEDWRQLMSGFERLQSSRRMNIILLAHAGIGSFKNPSGADYQRFKLKMYGDGPPSLWKEWCDHVLFATHELTFKGDGDLKKASETGRRILYTTYTAAHDAKNRWDLPEVLPFEQDTAYADLMAARGTGRRPAAAQEGV